jgi:predicted GIY-YIG superfamily endonuclease
MADTEIVAEKIKEWIEKYDEYLADQFEYPDDAKSEHSLFIVQTKAILNLFGLPNKKPFTTILYQIIDGNVKEKKIAPNLFRLCINHSTKLSTLIITTLKKLEQVKPYLSKMDVLFEDLYKEFEKSIPVTRQELPTYGGIYVFYEKGQAIYVGRANHIRNRIQWHTRKSSGSQSATFAFNLSKMEYEAKHGELKLKRKELMDTKEFKDMFEKHKKNLLNIEFKCIQIENDILQTMFEPYLALKVGTYPINNTFENH